MELFKATAVFVAFCVLSAISEKCKDDNYCQQGKTHGMHSADCYDKNFKAFPKCLRSDVEVVDASYNRLRFIENDDVSRYKNLKLLYLAENSIFRIDDSAFAGMDDLYSLDLSINAITKLPTDVFHLPSLKRLYLSQNQNINFEEIVEHAKPITSPLEYLDISYNDLDELPDLGVMPYMKAYNISRNNLVNLEPRHVAGLCNLEMLINENFTAAFPNPCDCWNVQKWLQQRNVKFTTILCPAREEECPYQISKDDMNTYQNCTSRYSEIVLKSNIMKIAIPIAVIGLLVIICLIWFIYRRRKRRSRNARRNDCNGALKSDLDDGDF